MRLRHLIYCYLLNTLLVTATIIYADSARKLVARGNQAYSEGRFDDAMSAYKVAEEKNPDSAHILFNKAAVYYQQGDYTNAANIFERAATMTDSPQLSAKSKYNRGNSCFRQAQELKSIDPSVSLEKCETSIRSYQEALELDPSMRQAAENLEIARFLQKAISEEMSRRKMQDSNSSLSTNFNEQLQNIVQAQQQLLDQTRQMSESNQTEEKQSEQGENLANKQKQLREQLEQLMQKSSEQQTKEQLQQAVQYQKEAEKQLRDSNWQNAAENEQQALDKTRDIQDKLSSKIAQSTEQQQMQEKEDRIMSGDQQSGERQIPAENDNQQMSPELSELRNILEEERKYKQMRKDLSAGYKPVDKDW